MCHSDFWFWQFQAFNPGAEALVVLMFWLDYFWEFHLAHNVISTGDLLISRPAVKHYAAMTSVFHFWQFQAFNCGAEELVVVLIWLDLWEILFLTTLEFELGIYGSAILHSSTEPQWILVFTSENLRYLTLVQRDWWWWCSDWTYARFSFCPLWDLDWRYLYVKSCILPMFLSDFRFSPLTISVI